VSDNALIGAFPGGCLALARSKQRPPAPTLNPSNIDIPSPTKSSQVDHHGIHPTTTRLRSEWPHIYCRAEWPRIYCWVESTHFDEEVFLQTSISEFPTPVINQPC
jgi:hypothetical protein